MRGQWIGPYSGSNVGVMMLDLDEIGGHYEGTAYLFESDGTPGTLASIRTPTSTNKQTFRIPNLEVLHPQFASVVGSEHLAQLFPGREFPRSADVELELRGSELHVKWHTSIGTSGSAVLPRSKADQPSEIESERRIRTWKTFKAFALKAKHNRFVYRGQPCRWRLRTTFHRSSRKDLLRLINTDIPMLHRALSAQTRHLFDLSEGKQYAAFWHLAQHHGYPTMFLDWTHSPYIAAFFAFRQAAQLSRKSGESVRVLQFDQKAWRADFKQLSVDSLARPHFSFIEPLAIENDRAVPQQSLSAITNVDDIEGYVRSQERISGRRYLRAIDLRFGERGEALRELSIMGITAGSLFPGIDGTCEAVRSRLFELTE